MLKIISTRHITATLFVFLSAAAQAEHVSNPKASYIDVQQRHAWLAKTKDPRTAPAIAALGSCTGSPLVPAPSGRMIIPPHYISGGHGPINPEEEKVTRLYSNFEHRVTAGMNQWLVTSSKGEVR